MNVFITNDEKIVETLLFVLNRVDYVDKHKLSKILYFADKSHLEKYGRTITGDSYVKMKFGPVPSRTYDLIKSSFGGEVPFHIDGQRVIPDRHENIEELSESDVICLNASIKEYEDKDFSELVTLSHDASWHKAEMNQHYSLDDFLETFENKETIKDHLENWD